MAKNDSAKVQIERMIKERPEVLFRMPIKDLASEINYSQAAITKAVKALGYTGLKDLKQNLYILNLATIKEKTEITWERDSYIFDSIIATDRSLWIGETLSKFARYLRSAKKIYVFGFGNPILVSLAKLLVLSLNTDCGLSANFVSYPNELDGVELKNAAIVYFVSGDEAQDLVFWASQKFRNMTKDKFSELLISTNAFTKLDFEVAAKLEAVYYTDTSEIIFSERIVVLSYLINRLIVEIKYFSVKR